MPDVGLTSASQPPDASKCVVIRYSVEVDGLPVYNESYDVDKLREELAADPEEVMKRWSWRLLGAAYCRNQHGFSACLTRSLIDGQGCACGHEDCEDLMSFAKRRGVER
jgi:hypothetical protein